MLSCLCVFAALNRRQRKDEISFFVSVSLFFRAERERQKRPRWLVLMNERREERERETSAAFAFVKDTFLSFFLHRPSFIYFIRERDRERYNRDPKESLNSLTKHTQRANDDIDGIIILRFTFLFFQRGFLEKKKFDDDDDKQALEKRKTKCIRASGNHRNFPGVARIVQVRDSSAHWTRGFREANVPMGGHDVHRRRFGDVREANGNFGDK